MLFQLKSYRNLITYKLIQPRKYVKKYSQVKPTQQTVKIIVIFSHQSQDISQESWWFCYRLNCVFQQLKSIKIIKQCNPSNKLETGIKIFLLIIFGSSQYASKPSDQKQESLVSLDYSNVIEINDNRNQHHIQNDMVQNANHNRKNHSYQASNTSGHQSRNSKWVPSVQVAMENNEQRQETQNLHYSNFAPSQNEPKSNYQRSVGTSNRSRFAVIKQEPEPGEQKYFASQRINQNEIKRHSPETSSNMQLHYDYNFHSQKVPVLKIEQDENPSQFSYENGRQRINSQKIEQEKNQIEKTYTHSRKYSDYGINRIMEQKQDGRLEQFVDQNVRPKEASYTSCQIF